jgi:hypothetical protein
MLANRLKEQGLSIKYNSKNGQILIRIEAKRRKVAIPNRISSARTSEEDILEREELLEKAVPVYRKMLPEILKKLSKIKDPRNVSYIKHKMTVLFAYGILNAIFHMKSRRQSNLEISRGVFFENLRDIFPELETMPHADTLSRLLEDIGEISQIQDCLIALIKDLIREKKFINHLIKNRYLIAIDGTQKQIRDYQYDKKALHKNYNECEKFYTYVVEAVFVLDNGIVFPFMSEILENEPNDQIPNKKNDIDSDSNKKSLSKKSEEEIKQDCENKGFKRLASRIKAEFPKLPITILLDGLYANGPIIDICIKNGWQFMITLKEKSLKQVWKEANALIRINSENQAFYKWGERKQSYTWANDIEYEYQDPNTKGYKKLILHVVFCYETWEEKHPRTTAKTEKKEANYAWISSEPITFNNVFFRCTKVARYRWGIENFILKEKHQGYNYEHFFSYNWNAMRGYHYLMHIGHFINAIALSSDMLISKVRETGIQRTIQFLKEVCRGAKICSEKIAQYRERKYILRLYN